MTTCDPCRNGGDGPHACDGANAVVNGQPTGEPCSCSRCSMKRRWDDTRPVVRAKPLTLFEDVVVAPRRRSVSDEGGYECFPGQPLPR